MNAPAKNTALMTAQSTALSGMSEDELINVLRNSLYPGAQTDSIKMILGYCKAAGLDPMQKPAHIVPIWDGKLKVMRDVVMPGIGLYRTMASRTGECAGVSEPEFGADVTETLGGATITYPTSCKVVVKRILPGGQIAEFAATERWKENYAIKGGADKSIAPNAMWTKRPYAQLAKCSEAQALRKAFPELGSAPTADEMEGKALEEVDVTPRAVIAEKPSLPTITADELATLCADKLNTETGEIEKMGYKSMVQSGKKTAENFIEWLSKKAIISEEIKAIIKGWQPIEAEGSAN